jgi:alpha-D-ribose 1-methylphosphonate 5-triphosphate diphosphatase
MTDELVLTNARVVTRHETFPGTIRVADGLITDVARGASAAAGAVDCDGDHLLPGLVELHTDAVERHLVPRPGVRWPALAAVVAHDGECAAAGITTVLDALALGDVGQDSRRLRYLRETAGALQHAVRLGVLRADHFLHLRCEVTYPQVLELFAFFAGDPTVRLVSVMDHTPGQRQWTDVAKYREFYQGQYGLTDEAMDAAIARQTGEHRVHAARHRAALTAVCRKRGLPLASHDDATLEHVEEAVQAGAVISEFPTTVEAARAARGYGLAVLAGAPNVVRGGSHSGNVAVRRLVELGLVDILSSDYYPLSLLHAAWVLHRAEPGFALAEAVGTVTLNPARRIGLEDRGEIAPGLRADLVRVREVADLPIVRAVWRRGARVA